MVTCLSSALRSSFSRKKNTWVSSGAASSHLTPNGRLGAVLSSVCRESDSEGCRYSTHWAMAGKGLRVAMFLGSVRENRAAERVGRFLRRELEDTSHEVAVFVSEGFMYRQYSAMAANKLKVVMFLGSVRENRMVDRVGKFLKKELEETSHDVTVFDPLEMKFPLLERALHHYRDKSQAPQWMRDAERKLQEADAVLVVTAEYNHSIPPALSNMMDHFGSSCYSYKPSAIVSYSPGVYGGMRAAMQLRAFLGELGCISVSNIFGIPEVHKALAEDGTPLNDHMKSGFSRLLKQMDWHAWAMKNHRDKEGVPK